MDNQHQHIKGYRDLTPAEIDAMNKVKVKAEEVGQLIEDLQNIPGVDLRWVSIAKTNLQQGFMAAVRAVAKPTTF